MEGNRLNNDSSPIIREQRMHDKGPDKRKRKTSEPLQRASVACVPCREKKTKCDRQYTNPHDSCLQCLQAERTCIFRFDDGRKRQPTKAYLSQFQNRIAALEEQQKKAWSQMWEKIQDSRVNLDYFDPGPMYTRDSMRPSTGSAFGSEAGSSLYNRSSMIKLVLNKRSISRDFGLAQRKLVRDSDYSPAETESSVDYVASDETGQFHYFGYTSNLQVVARFPPPPSPCSELSDSRDSSLEALADSESIKSQLLDLYFTYQNPATLIIEHETFIKAYRQGQRSSYFSTFLLNCILLRGIRLSDDPRVKSLDSIYLQRAKVELLGELENPNIATIQALCLFGHYQGSWGNDRACWLYPGIAYRLLFDLGLHQDCQDLIRAGFLTSSERKARHATLWGCYVSDKLYCIYQGRPSAVKLQDVAIPRPSLDTVGPQWETLDAWVDLASVLDEIITTFNKFPQNKAESNWLTATSNRLFGWLEHLPAHLQWNAQATPGICALHMQFLSVTIVLHRPFAVYKPRDTQPRSTDHSPSTLARRLCTENAIRISKLLLAFKNNYGTKKIFSTVCHMVLTAALSLISEISTEKGGNKRDEERKWLRVCFSILEELSSTFTVIGRNLKILTEIVESCAFEEFAISQDNGADGRETQQEKESIGENETAAELRSNLPTDSDIHRVNDLLSSFGGSLPFSLDLADGMMYLDPVPDGFAIDLSLPVGAGGYDGFAIDLSLPVGAGGYDGMDVFGFPSAENL